MIEIGRASVRCRHAVAIQHRYSSSTYHSPVLRAGGGEGFVGVIVVVVRRPQVRQPAAVMLRLLVVTGRVVCACGGEKVKDSRGKTHPNFSRLPPRTIHLLERVAALRSAGRWAFPSSLRHFYCVHRRCMPISIDLLWFEWCLQVTGGGGAAACCCLLLLSVGRRKRCRQTQSTAAVALAIDWRSRSGPALFLPADWGYMW